MIFYVSLFYFLAIVVLSAVSFVMYGWDKRQAANGGSRISERKLHTVALFGGWPGSIAGQKVFRHKTQKTSFRIVFYLTAAAHLLASLLILYWLFF